MVTVLGGENSVSNMGLVLNFGFRVMSYDLLPDQSCLSILILSRGTTFKSVFIEICHPISINRYIPVTWGLWVDWSLSHNSVDGLYHDTVNDNDKGDEDNEIYSPN